MRMQRVLSAWRPVWRFLDRLRTLLEWLGPFALLIAAFGLLFDMIATRLESDTTSWQALSSPTPGSGGRTSALIYLNSERKFVDVTIPYTAWINQKFQLSKTNEPGEFAEYGDIHFDIGFNFGPWKTRDELQGIDLSLGKDPSIESTNCNRSNAIIFGVDLKRSKLQQANFSCVEFINGERGEATDFSDANIGRAVFRGTTLWGAKFAGANAEHALFDYAKFIKTDMAAVDAKGASFIESQIDTDTKFFGAELDNAIFDKVAVKSDRLENRSQPLRLDLSGASLRSAQFLGRKYTVDFKVVEIHDDSYRLQGKDIANSNMRVIASSNLQKRILENHNWKSRIERVKSTTLNTAAPIRIRTDLSDAKMSNIDWGSSNFSGANVEGADFRGADLSQTVGLTYEQLKKACVNEFTALPNLKILKGLPLHSCPHLDDIGGAGSERRLLTLGSCRLSGTSVVDTEWFEATVDGVALERGSIALCLNGYAKPLEEYQATDRLVTLLNELAYATDAKESAESMQAAAWKSLDKKLEGKLVQCVAELPQPKSEYQSARVGSSIVARYGPMGPNFATAERARCSIDRNPIARLLDESLKNLLKAKSSTEPKPPASSDVVRKSENIAPDQNAVPYPGSSTKPPVRDSPSPLPASPAGWDAQTPQAQNVAVPETDRCVHCKPPP